MKKVKNMLVILGTLLLVSGCGTNETYEKEKKIVTDDAILNILSNHIISLEGVPTTLELYKKSSFNSGDYSNDDILYFGLNAALGLELDVDLTKQEIVALSKKGFKDVGAYISVNDIDSVINDTFGAINVKYSEKSGQCPYFTYDESNDRYYVSTVCESKSDKIISYINGVTNQDNDYYVDVYFGVISDNKVFGNLEKTNSIYELEPEESYTIDNANKDKFTLVKYTFTKNSDGKYVFANAKVE